MKKAIAILAVLSLAAYAGQIAIESGTVPEKDADWLRYDNGTYHWITWAGTYRGVWFDTQDFIPGSNGVEVLQAEIWFGHGSTLPWDTSDFYLELWNGDSMGPMTQLDQTMATASNLTPIYVDYDPSWVVDQNFWILQNAEMSAGGWPCILGDNSQGSTWGGVPHSLFSDDFIVWEPWGINELSCNFFVGALVEPLSFSNTSWGSLKTAF